MMYIVSVFLECVFQIKEWILGHNDGDVPEGLQERNQVWHSSRQSTLAVTCGRWLNYLELTLNSFESRRMS